MKTEMQHIEHYKIISLIKEKNLDAAFKMIVSTYQKPLYWHIRQIVKTHENADDVIQETFIKIWKYLHKFKGESNIYTWLFRIATNEAITYLNKINKRKETSIETNPKSTEQTTQELINVNSESISKKLASAILSLPEKQRIVFNLKYFEELKYSQIAEITSTSVGALKASYHLATKKIEEFLKQH